MSEPGSDMKPLALWLLTLREQHPHVLMLCACVHCCKVDCKGAAVNVNSCVDQIGAVTPRFACRSNRLDLQGF